MQCPICSTELDPDAVNCEKCGATRVTQRTPTGVIVGWVGMTVALLWAMLGIPLLILPFTEHGISGYPWAVFIVGVVIAAGLLQYSKSTLHAIWVRRGS
jgi:hypothetical protein